MEPPSLEVRLLQNLKLVWLSWRRQQNTGASMGSSPSCHCSASLLLTLSTGGRKRPPRVPQFSVQRFSLSARWCYRPNAHDCASLLNPCSCRCQGCCSSPPEQDAASDNTAQHMPNVRLTSTCCRTSRTVPVWPQHVWLYADRGSVNARGYCVQCVERAQLHNPMRKTPGINGDRLPLPRSANGQSNVSRGREICKVDDNTVPLRYW